MNKPLIICLCLCLATAASALAQGGDRGAVDAALGKKGKEKDTVYKVEFVRTDIKAAKAGADVPPGIALGSWVGFMPAAGKTMVMGEFAVTEEELPAVMRSMVKSGLEVAAVHNHLAGVSPPVMFIHFSGMGEEAKLARDVREVLAQTRTPVGEEQKEQASRADWSAVEKVLGQAEKKEGDMAEFEVKRSESIRHDGLTLPPAMEVASMVKMSMKGGQACAAGELVLLDQEVAPVAKILVENGYEVTAIHNHMLRESPRLFFLHCYACQEPVKLAQGVRAALDATKSSKTASTP